MQKTNGTKPSQLRNVAASALMRQAIIISLLFTASTLLAGVLAYVLLSNELRVRLGQDARQMAENLAVTYQVAGVADLKAQIATNSATTRDFSNLYLFVDENQSIVFGNFNIRKPFVGPAQLKLGDDVVLPHVAATSNSEEFLAYGIRIHAGWIITARNMRWIGDTRTLLVQSAVWGLGIALALSIVLSVILARRSERRITDLNNVLDRVAGGDLTARYQGKTRQRDDLSRVAVSINRMLDQLSLTMDSLRQVSNDVAHDLRTPLTRLKSRIEPLTNRADLPPDALSDIQGAEEEVDAIVKTFNAVLRIAQIEGHGARAITAEMDPFVLCRDIHEMMAPVAEEMGHHLSLDCPSTPLLIKADREMLAQAIVNLVENAVRHCPAPADIRISASGGGKTAVIAVCDNGQGIPEHERTNVLRRFYRLEKSRNTQGSGLGLSLVAAIAKRLGGTLVLADNAPGLCATITISAS